ncbi:MAG: hypothetical protein AAGF91_06385 [Actinomycetota bacterium]
MTATGDDAALRSSGGLDGPIELIVPAAIEMAAMVRLMSAALGAEVGLSLDEVDDVRLAAAEVFAAAVDADGSDRVAVTFEVLDGAVSARFVALGGAAIVLDELGAQILECGVDEVEVGEGTVRFVKHSGSNAD